MLNEPLSFGVPAAVVLAATETCCLGVHVDRPIKSLFILLIAMGVFAQSSLFPPHAFVPTTICTLSHHPDTYSGKMVRVRAYLLSDRLHGAALADASCKNAGIALDFNDGTSHKVKLVKDDDYRQFDGLYARVVDLNRKHKRIYATFEGLFESHPDTRPSRVFVLHRVSQLRVDDH